MIELPVPSVAIWPLGSRPQPVGCAEGAAPVRNVTVLPFTVIESPSAGDDPNVVAAVAPISVLVPARFVALSAALATAPVSVPAVDPSDAPSEAPDVTGVTPPGAPV